MLSFLAAGLVAIVLIEIIFRLNYRRKHGHDYHVSFKLPWKKMYVVSHPYLSFAYKRNTVIDRNQKLPYELHYHRFSSFKQPLRLNNLGHFGKDFSPQKDPRTLRVACIGASTTANNIADDERDYTYPALLEAHLQAKFKAAGIDREIEVLNCGIGGWTSPDIFINFTLNVLPLKPDYIVLYHGFNDLHLYLTPSFHTDYSHSRKNLGEVLAKIRLSARLPKIPFLHAYESTKDRIFGTGNVRNDVLRMITATEPDYDREFQDLGVEKDILKHIVVLARHYGIEVLIGSFVHYNYQKNPVADKFGEGVRIQNRHRQEIAEELGVDFVDQARSFTMDKEYFVDSIHFSPAGMKRLAENFGDALFENYRRKN
ncbi:MAG: SGNH/GDSL hydrolase family protein [Bacteriovoracia bacterium]